MNAQLVKGLVAATAMTFAAQAGAASFGYDATIWDGNNDNGGSYAEDEETESGQTAGWDMEGVFYNYESHTLTIVGEFDLVTGSYGGFDAGDIFLSVDKPVYGDVEGTTGFNDVANTYGYDYVIDLDYETGTWNLLSIDETATVKTAFHGTNQGSNPFEYVSGGTVITSGTFAGEEATDTGFVGDKHYSLSIDLEQLMTSAANNTTFYSHFTMGCGNDNLMGSWTVPEPTTLALLTMGIAGLWFSRRKQVSKGLTA